MNQSIQFADRLDNVREGATRLMACMTNSIDISGGSVELVVGYIISRV